MNVSNIIVDFANANKEFRTNDLSEYLSGKIELSKKMLSWHLRKLAFAKSTMILLTFILLALMVRCKDS